MRTAEDNTIIAAQLAADAEHANSADTANSANSATNATNLGGSPAAEYLKVVNLIAALLSALGGDPNAAKVIGWDDVTNTIKWLDPAAGGGTGDMSKSTYDTNNNGKVDIAEDSEKLGGTIAASYALKTYVDAAILAAKASEQSVDLAIGSLAAGAYATGSLSIARLSVLKRLTSDNVDVRVRLYQTAAQRDADLARTFGDRSYLTTNHGMICDIKLTASTGSTWRLPCPATVENGDIPTSGLIYYTVSNEGVLSAAYNLSFKHLILEA